MKNFKKVICKISKLLLISIRLLNVNLFNLFFYKNLIFVGIKLLGKPNFISHDVYFDCSDYILINLTEEVTISTGVNFLTLDGSLHTVSKGINKFLMESKKIELEFVEHISHKIIFIAENTFIGARVLLLPGTNIGHNCLIGAGSVVRGKIPHNSVVIGNPAIILSKTPDFLKRKSLLVYN